MVIWKIDSVVLGCMVVGMLLTGCGVKDELVQTEVSKTISSDTSTMEVDSEQIQFLYGTCELGDYSICFYRNTLNEIIIEASRGKEDSQVAIYSEWKDYAYSELEESLVGKL